MSEIVQPPLNTFRFAVILTVDNPGSLGVTNPICQAAFSECSGLDMSMEVESIKEGGYNTREKQLFGPITYGTLKLSRGMTFNLQLWNWFSAVAKVGQAGAAQGQVVMYDTRGEPAIIFRLENCLPKKITGPTLSAQDSKIAIEQLEIAYSALTIVPADGAGVTAASQDTSGNNVSGGPDLGGSSPTISSNNTNQALLTLWDVAKNKAIGEAMPVDFNPTSLKIRHASFNTGGRKTGAANPNASYQVTKFVQTLELELLFDTSQEQGNSDVRNKTLKLVELLNPAKDQVLPGLHFHFGTFIFIGYVTGIQEKLDLFKDQGIPLRSTLNITLEGVMKPASLSGGSGSSAAGAAGTKPLRTVKSGETLQSIAGPNWQKVAAKNNIDNPRHVKQGTLLDVNQS